MSLQTIRLTRFTHRGERQVGLSFRYDDSLIREVKKIPGARWSQTYRCWYVQDRPGLLKEVLDQFRGLAWVDYTALAHKSPKKMVNKKGKLDYPSMQAKKRLSDQVKKELDRTMRYLEARGFSERTLQVYRFALETFFRFTGKEGKDLTPEDITQFQSRYFVQKGYSAATQRQFISALKHYLKVNDIALDPGMLAIPKREKHLPRVLSQKEVMQILVSIKNMKHFMILSLMYSSGLRISELIHLKLEDVLFDRAQLHIKQGKGKKDRYVGISKHLLKGLGQYIDRYKPEVYLFNGQHGPYTASSVRKVLQKAAMEAGLNRKVSPHMLRHSYATHLLEDGVDIRYIQELLGHARPETTMIYTHVTTKQLTDIRNPLDSLIERFSNNGNKSGKKFLLSGK